MRKLSDILYKVRLMSVKGVTDLHITGICIDSRQCRQGYLFIAQKGLQVDGHQYITKATDAGAIAVVCEELPFALREGVTYIQVMDSHEAAGHIAHSFYQEPSRQITLVGVTGTNGKTTVATLLYKLFTSLGYHCGLISTVENKIGRNTIASTHTTPDAVTLNQLLFDMVAAGCTHVFMECSSHAIHQHRMTALHFKVAIFTNITHDHLDYHKTFDEYVRVKKSFFDSLEADAYAISNLDDKRGTVMLQNTKATKKYYALKNMADFKARILENGLRGLVLVINELEMHCRLIGEFNAYNLLAVYGAAVSLGEAPEETLRVLSQLQGAEGRFDTVAGKKNITGIIDYAHTPDALANVLTTIHQLKQDNQQVITVIGCGGDRDSSKRPVMALVAANNSDQVILTSDNPRSENPLDILAQMYAGLTSAGKRKTRIIENRKDAIREAIDNAEKNTIILIAGKGHEKYQEIQGVKYDFDDKQVFLELMNNEIL
jgi:UDP-N-acetylmuramoyl-L-alanyl-D-glutamate--2,6-diaminopimelate ligase